VSALCRSDAAYVLGALAPADRRDFEDHLRDCAECRESVQRLAGMPGLLALTTAEAVEDPGPAVPDSILPTLIGRAALARRRRRWLVGGLLAASVAVVFALIGALVREVPEPYSAAGGATTTAAAAPPSGAPSAATTPPAVEQSMTRLLPGPLTASYELSDKRWGTAITVICRYDQEVDPAVAYDLAVIDTEGRLAPAGTWRAVPGATTRIAAATALPRDRIAWLEVRLPDGQPIFRSAP